MACRTERAIILLIDTVCLENLYICISHTIIQGRNGKLSVFSTLKTWCTESSYDFPEHKIYGRMITIRLHTQPVIVAISPVFASCNIEP